ncbi:MAG TPA: hypothetical protein VIL41_00475 [Coriobacteriia bacterium]
MRLSRDFSLVTLACALALAMVPAVALGATKTAAAPTLSKAASPTPAPLVEGAIDAQIWPAADAQLTAVIVDVSVDPKIKLPARVRIPVPNGAVVQWAGEILGGSASADIQRDFTLHPGAGGGQYAEFTLSVSRRGQIDTSGIPMTARGTVLSTQVDFVQSVSSTSTIFTVRMPAGVSQVKIEPSPVGAPETNSAGESLYPLPTKNLATGAKQTVKVSYNTSPTGATPSAGINLTAVYVVLGVLLVGAISFAAYLLARQGSVGDDDATELEDEEPGPSAPEDVADADAGSPSDDSEPADDPFDLDETDWFGKD